MPNIWDKPEQGFAPAPTGEIQAPVTPVSEQLKPQTPQLPDPDPEGYLNLLESQAPEDIEYGPEYEPLVEQWKQNFIAKTTKGRDMNLANWMRHVSSVFANKEYLNASQRKLVEGLEKEYTKQWMPPSAQKEYKALKQNVDLYDRKRQYLAEQKAMAEPAMQQAREEELSRQAEERTKSYLRPEQEKQMMKARSDRTREAVIEHMAQYPGEYVYFNTGTIDNPKVQEVLKADEPTFKDDNPSARPYRVTAQTQPSVAPQGNAVDPAEIQTALQTGMYKGRQLSESGKAKLQAILNQR